MEQRTVMAITTALGKRDLSLMSAWMVGKVEAPAKANMIELKAFPKPRADCGGGWCGLQSGSES